ncbi:MAG: hypothetical protein V1706_02040 [Pseudomonadota bacterium]
MQQILSLQAAEGMVLAKDVNTPDGRVLCGKGTSLTASMIDRFVKMEVSHITVEGHPVQIEGEKSLEQELADIDKRFARVKHVPPLMYIRKKIMQRKIASRKGP